ncbi:ribonuclease HI [Geminocystis sp. NIES-3709]|uniref:ribonuclease HI n=1 Tax=Geminocystis sp. NIES-3709 TaxID=1617448 RepID=UPI0005FCA77A|nr:ribonuclease HI [Geminocystis sp. NIES-3709]BAQ65480.1 ribonuclease HI [Geminocystis sp. NIES-3709]
MNDQLPQVEIYTDGSCLNNPGPGGYGVVLLAGDNRKELSGGFERTTNNRMEILAVIKGLEALKKPCRVNIYTDSQYVVNAISKGWAKKWQKNNWRRNGKEKAKNPDLWQILLQLCNQHQVNFIWVRGHSGNKENERCDRLAFHAAQGSDLEEDIGMDN